MMKYWCYQYSFSVLLMLLQNVVVLAKEFHCYGDICNTDHNQYCDSTELERRCVVCPCDDPQQDIQQCFDICAKKMEPTTLILTSTMSMPSSSSSESGSESDYVAAVVTILLLLALIAVGLVIYLYKYQKACFAPSTTPNSSPGSSNNSLLEKPTIVNINEPPIFKKKSPIQEEGKGLLNTNLHTSPTADLHSYQHKKVFNPCENLINDMTHEPEETEQTSLKHV